VINRLLLDTHVALWLDSGDDRLRAATRALIDGCWQNGGTIFLSAVTAWEIALLVDTGRIDLDVPPRSISTPPLTRGSSASSRVPA
jgi:PIN domain nuclease of toxin-antitoxin system